MFSQFCPASPNFAGFGLSRQYDSAIPIAIVRVSTNEKMASPGETSRIDSKKGFRASTAFAQFVP
jgi:hypothetical protein